MATMIMNPPEHNVLRPKQSHILSQKQEEASRFRFYYPNLRSMEEVKSMLRPYVAIEGVFILRNSFSKPGEITFSVTHGGGLKHFTLLGFPGEYYLHGKPFPSIEALCQFYYENEVPNVEEIPLVQLKKPLLPQNSPTSASARSPNGVTSSTGPLRFSRQPSGSSTSSGSGSGGSTTFRRPHPNEGSHSTVSGIGAHGGMSSPPMQTAKPNPISRNHDDAVNTHARAKSEMTPSVKRVDSSNNSSRSRSLSEARPMQPLPPEAYSSQSNSPYYSLPRPLDQDQLPVLMAQLERMPQTGKCQCGLDVDDSTLPCGWSVHISQDPISVGRPFFEGPGQETSWQAPMEVSLNLSQEQQDFIRDLYNRWRLKIDNTGAATSSSHDSLFSSGGAVGQDEVFH